MNRGVNRIFATTWRLILIIIVYICLSVPAIGLLFTSASGQAIEIPMLFQSLLKAAANNFGYFPDDTYFESWRRFVGGYSMNCLYISLFLVAVWNIIYSSRALGRNHERSALAMFWLFLALHVIMLLFYLIFHFTRDILTWNWLLDQSWSRNIILLLPQILILPFAVCIRLLCPYRIYPMFALADMIRAPLGLRVYSRRGAR